MKPPCAELRQPRAGRRESPTGQANEGEKRNTEEKETKGRSQACYHLGLLENTLPPTHSAAYPAKASAGRTTAFPPPNSHSPAKITTMVNQPLIPTITETETVSQLLSRIKFLLRHKTAAIGSRDAGLHSEAIRHFSNIVEGRRGAPQGFLTECCIHRASAYRFVGRFTESIADCNRALALGATYVEALSTRDL
ncbi:hypothetical protein U1Q18_031591 [Sarracenia purpurea var. burkii]